MEYTFKQLRYVQAVAQHGSIANAAEKLNIAQSSITAAIDTVEKSLGYDVFIRRPAKGVEVTSSGVKAIEHIDMLLEKVEHLSGDLKSIGGTVVGSLRIGCYTPVAPVILPIVLKDFARDRPGLKVEVMDGDVELLYTYLRRGWVDIAFTYVRFDAPRMCFRTLFEARPHALFAIDDPLCQREVISLKELASKPLIALDVAIEQTYLRGLFNDHGLQPNIARTSPSPEIIRGLVASGFGYTILNIRPLQSPKYDVRPIVESMRETPFAYATLEDANLSGLVLEFKEYCERLSEAGAFDSLVVAP